MIYYIFTYFKHFVTSTIWYCYISAWLSSDSLLCSKLQHKVSWERPVDSGQGGDTQQPGPQHHHHQHQTEKHQHQKHVILISSIISSPTLLPPLCHPPRPRRRLSTILITVITPSRCSAEARVRRASTPRGAFCRRPRPVIRIILITIIIPAPRGL